MKTEKWYKIRIEFASMFADYLANKITYAEIENKVIECISYKRRSYESWEVKTVCLG